MIGNSAYKTVSALPNPANDATAIAAELSRLGFEVIDAECVGCNLCFLACPVDGCITMVRQDTGAAVLTWDHHPNNPLRKEAAS